MKEGSGAADKSKIAYTGVDMESIVLNKMIRGRGISICGIY